MIDLGKTEELARVDTSNMVGVLERFPEQCEQAVKLASEFDLGSLPENIESEFPSAVIFLGMGASGIGGDIVKAVSEPELACPVLVNKGYALPQVVDSSSLVFAVSYSGETEETLTVFEECVRLGAQIIAVTSGGRLLARARELGLPVLEVPTGYQPRVAVGLLGFPLLLILKRLGLVTTDESAEAVHVLKDLAVRLKRDVPVADNPAKLLAERLYRKLPVVYGSDGVAAVAAYRFKCELNENSKSPAFHGTFPELDHNEIVGWEMLEDVTQRFALVILRSRDEHERVARRIEVTVDLIRDHLADVIEVWSEGSSRLAQLFSLIYLGDFASVYLALLYGIDPTPVERIRMLKESLKQSEKGK